MMRLPAILNAKTPPEYAPGLSQGFDNTVMIPRVHTVIDIGVL